MSSFKLLAAVSLILGSLGLGGCIANTEGSTPEDFAAQTNSAAAAQENNDTASNGQANCPDEACQAVTLEKRTLAPNSPSTLAPLWVALPAPK